jgi:hypothetical protein
MATIAIRFTILITPSDLCFLSYFFSFSSDVMCQSDYLFLKLLICILSSLYLVKVEWQLPEALEYLFSGREKNKKLLKRK